MPHRVATFFRSHSTSSNSSTTNNNTSFNLSQPESKKTVRSLSGFVHRRPSLGDRSSTTSASSTHSTDPNMSDSHKRLSLAGLTPKINPKNSNRSLPLPVAPAKMRLEEESPPLVLYGSTANSTGALFSGQLKVKVETEKLEVESFSMRLVLETKMTKPFHPHCKDCDAQETELKRWQFNQGPLSLSMKEHSFPFSYLFKGHLPATTHGKLSSIDYVLKAIIRPSDPSIEPIILKRSLDIKRAIVPSDLPRQSLRIFPPTNITASVSIPSAIYPIGEFTCSLRVNGIIKRNEKTGMQTHWKLKRLLWRLEETQKVISPACLKHTIKAGGGPNDKKGISHQEVRILGSGELKRGWKGDYSHAAGSIETEFQYGIKADTHPICDVKAEDGTEISHSLVIEMIVAEEIAPIRNVTSITPTGAARVLRMHFVNVLTERSGLGISWDEEQPPLYEDVPESPPRYPKPDPPAQSPMSPLTIGVISNYEGPEIPDYTELDQLHERASMDENGGEGSSSRPRFATQQQAAASGSGSARPNRREFIDILQDESDIRPGRREEAEPETDFGMGGVE